MIDKLFKICVVICGVSLLGYAIYRFIPIKANEPKAQKQIILVQINNQNLTMYDGSVEQSPVRINENGEFVMAYMIRLNVPQQPQVPPQPRAEVVPGPEK